MPISENPDLKYTPQIYQKRRKAVHGNWLTVSVNGIFQRQHRMTTATILIRDEVNCKMIGLDLPLRQKLVKQFKVDVPHARHLPSVKLGRWDGRIAFVQLGGNTYINMLEEILPILIDEGYDIQLDDRRNYSSHFKFPEVTAQTFSHITWPEGHRLEGEPIVLNDHQVVCINDFLQNPQCMQEIATGSGKCRHYDSATTIIFDEQNKFGAFLLNKYNVAT